MGHEKIVNATLSMAVPTANSAANVTLNDVVGNKSDTSAGDSLYSKIVTSIVTLAELEKSLIAVGKVYPTLAVGVTITAATAYVLGTIIEVVPASTIAAPFTISSINLDTISAAGIFELVLYQGASDVEIGRCRFTQSPLLGLTSIPIKTSLVPANARIRAKVATETGAAETVTITVSYQTY
jgi:hypothetical protein